MANIAGPNNTELVRWLINQLQGRPFVLIVFLLVLAGFVALIVRTKREIKACTSWDGRTDPKQKSQIVSQLQLFLGEAERWRIQGVAVPMTDYSDRIDSFIEGLADSLHNVVNLFLIVGLAGTFFGMAEFARQAPGLVGAADPRSVLDALRTALGHSFPIGFLGLCLTILGHPFASYYEGRLREAAKDAINEALKLRTATLTQGGSEALIDVISKLPENLASAIALTHADFIDRLQPLLTLPEVLEKSHIAAIAPLRELFAASQTEWRDTVTRLGQQTKRIADSTSKLEAPIVGLTAKIGDIGDLISSTQGIVSRVLGDIEKVSAHTEQLRLEVEGTAKALKSAAEQLSTVPGSVRADLQNLHEVLRESIRAYYENLGSSYVAQVRDYAVGASGDITRAARQASEELTAAANSLRASADALTPELRNAIQQGASQLRGHLEEFNEAFGRHFPKAVADLQETLKSASMETDAARAVLEAMTASSKLAAEHVQEWKKVESSLRDLSMAVNGNREQMDRSATAIKTSAEAHSQAAEMLRQSVIIMRPLKTKDGSSWWPRWPWGRKGGR